MGLGAAAEGLMILLQSSVGMARAAGLLLRDCGPYGNQFGVSPRGSMASGPLAIGAVCRLRCQPCSLANGLEETNS